ncbi:MAG TPA: hypothetical protein VGQ21_01890 [Thermoanaerobaculia bacterium]|jgi:hypothetical protein|nr:hypothetical protein [Thermoanaerobaculia bacterium]
MSPLFLALGIVGASVILEMIVSWRWTPSYFRFGIPIFIRRIERAGGVAAVSIEPLEKSSRTATGPPFAFRQLGPDLIGFRERGFNGYVPLMRGVIMSRLEEPFVVVAGLVNWSAIVVAIVLIAFLQRGVADVAPYLLGALAILYFIQGVRFYRVASALRGPAHAEEKVAGA